MAFVVASTAVHDLLRAEVRPARVVAVTAAAVYLSVATGRPDDPGLPTHARWVALLARDAVRVPIGLVTALPRHDLPFAGLRPGDSAALGDGVLRLETGHDDNHVYQPLRYWDPRVPRLRAGLATAEVRHRAEALALLAADLPDDVIDHWVGAVAPLGIALAPATPRPEEVAAAVGGLLGLGPGLTPAGDDVLAGALVTLAAAGAECRRRTLATEVGRLLHRTTPVSAALLVEACRGRAVPEVTVLLRALASSSHLDAALAGLAVVGHTSGAALALGVRLALCAVDRRELGRAA